MDATKHDPSDQIPLHMRSRGFTQAALYQHKIEIFYGTYRQIDPSFFLYFVFSFPPPCLCIINAPTYRSQDIICTSYIHQNMNHPHPHPHPGSQAFALAHGTWDGPNMKLLIIPIHIQERCIPRKVNVVPNCRNLYSRKQPSDGPAKEQPHASQTQSKR